MACSSPPSSSSSSTSSSSSHPPIRTRSEKSGATRNAHSTFAPRRSSRRKAQFEAKRLVVFESKRQLPSLLRWENREDLLRQVHTRNFHAHAHASKHVRVRSFSLHHARNRWRIGQTAT
jgi:hypothetical protein